MEVSLSRCVEIWLPGQDGRKLKLLDQQLGRISRGTLKASLRHQIKSRLLKKLFLVHVVNYFLQNSMRITQLLFGHLLGIGNSFASSVAVAVVKGDRHEVY